MANCGIYQIISHIHPDRTYIGSAINIEERWKGHLFALKNNKHHSLKLQRHYNKYGLDDLIFEVIESGEYFDKNHLLSREQGWFWHFRYRGSDIPYFNTSKQAGSQLGYKHTTKTRKEISKKVKGKTSWSKGLTKNTNNSVKKISDGMIGNTNSLGFKHTQETRDKISKGLTGIKRSEETRKKVGFAGLGRIPWNKGKKTGHIPWNKNKKTGITPRSTFKKGHVPWNKGLNWKKDKKNGD